MSRDHDDTHERGTLSAGSRELRPRSVLVVTLDSIGARMAGPAIRALHLADELARDHEVVLASTKPVDIPPGTLDLRHAGRRELGALAEWAEVIIVQGFALAQHPVLGREDRILVVDAYAPVYLEQLEQARGLGARAHGHVVRSGVEVMNSQLARADFVICGSERQRSLWLGTMGAIGRINPSTYGADPSLRNLIDVVPFGLSGDRPRRRRPAIKGVVPGIGPEDRVVMWGGGVYAWFDPLTLIRAMALVADDHPDVKLFFLGLVHPNPDVGEMDVAGAARRLSADLGLTDRVVFFNETWVSYDERADYLLDADIGVSCHFDHVEATFAFRTRILDYLWAGLPMVLTEGDVLAETVAVRGAGKVVPPGQPELIRDAIVALLDRQEWQRCSSEAAELASEYEWRRVVGPLSRWLRAPSAAADRRLSVRASVSSTLKISALRKDVSVAAAVARRDGVAGLASAVRHRLQR